MLMRKYNKLYKMINSTLIDLPTPSNLTFYWNMGSLLAMCLISQILTGSILAMHYKNDISMAFWSVSHINRDVNMGWLIRSLHSNMVSMFFIMIYLHIGRGLYYTSYHNKTVWMSGIMMLLLVMMTAFMGYVLPWGQMSYWGATVITNLISTIPYIGTEMTYWIWGNFSVNNPTLTRFYSLHFMLPFIISLLMLIHILLLHNMGSTSPMGNNSNIDKIPFHPYYTYKDLLGLCIMMFMMFIIVTLYPNIMMDPENFLMANPLSTPPHIQPEWYFLFAYAILRSIPNKIGGVVALIMAILILMLPMISKFMYKNLAMKPIKKILFWVFINVFMMLTFLGSCPIEYPFMIMSQLMTTLYFSFFIFMSL
uniref:Cytochrome b n=1 Tax=Chiropterargas boueti TaxID=1827022 RepID=A0A1P8AG50_9ACAR|nr:cytochrome b [Chiropterargas boueti]AMX74090.1 cytochrome b [Chiropterargas boueti]